MQRSGNKYIFTDSIINKYSSSANVIRANYDYIKYMF